METGKIDYNELIEVIQDELVQIMNNPPVQDFYKGYKVILSSELQYVKEKDKDPKAIYIILKFGSATVTFGQSILPMSLTAMGEENKLNVCRQLMADFAEEFNLKRVKNNTIQQILEAPEVISNFDTIYSGFRSLLTVSGTFIVSKNANFFTLYDLSDIYNPEAIDTDYIYDKDVFGFIDDGEKFLKEINGAEGTYTFFYSNGDYSYRIGETITPITDINEYGLKEVEDTENEYYFSVDIYEVPLITSAFGADIELDTQAFYYKKNFTESVGKLGTLTFNFTSYLLDNYPVFNKAISIVTKNIDKCPNGINTTFKMVVKFKSGDKLIDNFKMVNFTSQQNLGEIPVSSFVFTN